MPVAVDLNNLPPFPKRIPEKLKKIREHFNFTPDEIAPKVGARTGAENARRMQTLAFDSQFLDHLLS